MKPVKILSIDFDYFIDTDKDTRNNIFPDGVDEMPVEELKEKWNEVYRQYPFVKDIGVIPQYDLVIDLLKKCKDVPVVVYPSHKELYNVLISNYSTDTPLEVYNIDFHHDMYHFYTGGNPLNCSNWARRMLEQYPNSSYYWFRRTDSEQQTLFGAVECPNSPFLPLELDKLEDIDVIFICESPEWTPPHLKEKYLDMVRTAIK